MEKTATGFDASLAHAKAARDHANRPWDSKPAPNNLVEVCCTIANINEHPTASQDLEKNLCNFFRGFTKTLTGGQERGGQFELGLTYHVAIKETDIATARQIFQAAARRVGEHCIYFKVYRPEIEFVDC